MSAPNFRTQKDFGLYVNDFVIPIYEDEENENSEVVEYLTDWHELRAVEKAVDELNRTLEFYSVELIDGYYTGVQFYVDEKNGDYDLALPSYYTADEWREIRKEDSSYSRNYFPYSYSETVRRMNSERRKINKWFEQIAVKEFGFIKYACVGIFSNGEAVYTKVA